MLPEPDFGEVADAGPGERLENWVFKIDVAKEREVFPFGFAELPGFVAHERSEGITFSIGGGKGDNETAGFGKLIQPLADLGAPLIEDNDSFDVF